MRRIVRRRSHPVLFRLAIVLLLVAICIVVGDMLMRPTVSALAANRAEFYASQLVAEAVEGVLEQQPSLLDGLVAVAARQDGSVTSIQVDAAVANRLKSAVELAINRAFAPAADNALLIPFGTLTGWQLLSGVGPSVRIGVGMLGSPAVEMRHELASAGINQTVHRVQLVVSVQVEALLPFYTVSARSDTQYLAAETVVVGDVPQFYAGLGE